MSSTLFARSVSLSVIFFALAGASVANAQTEFTPQDFQTDQPIAPLTSQSGSNITPVNNDTFTPAPSTNAANNPGATTNAANNPATDNATLQNPLKNIPDLQSLLNAILGALLQLAEIVLVLMFVWVGFSFVRAQGKPEELKKTRTALLWTIIGAAIILGAREIGSVIQTTVNGL